MTDRDKAVELLARADIELLFDAYKALLVLHRMLDKQGLTLGVKTAEDLADRIVKAHPEFPPRTALRAAALDAKG